MAQQMQLEQEEPPSPDHQQPPMMVDNQQDYDEMDLIPYEDDDDATLHRKYCAAKIARKRAEEDLKLLCNRIGLLKMEEGKVSHSGPNQNFGPFSIPFRLLVSNAFLVCCVGCEEDRRD